MGILVIDTVKKNYSDYSMVTTELKTVIGIARQAGEKIMAIYNRVQSQDDLTMQTKDDHFSIDRSRFSRPSLHYRNGLKSLETSNTPISPKNLLCLL